MPDAHFQPGQSFALQLAWRLPKGDYVRAVFQADVEELVPAADKYVVCLRRLLAGREDDDKGTARQLEALEGEYWDRVQGLIGRRITIAYEADDGRPLYLRLATLTGEHDFFTRYERGVKADQQRLDQEETTDFTNETDLTNAA